MCLLINCTVLDDLKEAPAVNKDFIQLELSLYITFKSGIAFAGEPIPLEYKSFGK